MLSQSVQFNGSPSNFVSVSFGMELANGIWDRLGGQSMGGFMSAGAGKLAIHDAVDFALALAFVAGARVRTWDTFGCHFRGFIDHRAMLKSIDSNNSSDQTGIATSPKLLKQIIDIISVRNST